jgi:3' terminal RNA ribose 2'-O-methyltransferase Hen1
MLLTITSTTPPATDLGFLLHKNPNRAQSFTLGFGQAHVFYPEASADRCTAALLLDVDSVRLVRGRGAGGGSDQDGAQYVSDRPYVASSFLSVAIGEVFGTALAGRSRERAELAATALPLEARLFVMHARGGEGLLRRLFEPLGYEVEARAVPLDETFPAWGDSQYFAVSLRATCRVRDLLAHLTVLVPVLDDRKHYFVGDDEIEKLVRRGEGWLAHHPARSQIAERYLKHRRGLVRTAIERLQADEAESDDADEELAAAPVRRLGLHDQRIAAVMAALKQSGARSVIDLGCGEGRLLRELLADSSFERIVGLDVSYRGLERARARLTLDRLPPRQVERITLLHGALTYRDRRLAGFDAAAVVEVIEHLDPPRLAAFERVVFEHARPGSVVVTTPNVEHNVRYPGLSEGGLRHADHRFEWTRAEFRAWAERVATRFGYRATLSGVGPEDPEVGCPSQLAVFTR